MAKKSPGKHAICHCNMVCHVLAVVFDSVPQDIRIPLSFIHPWWLFKAPELVEGWHRSVDPSIAMEGDQHLIIKQDEVQDEDDNSSGESGESRESDGGDTDGGSGAWSQRTAAGMTPGMTALGVASGDPNPTHLGDRFKSRGAIMIDEKAINVYNTHNYITDAAKKELYIKELDNNIKM